MEPRIATLLGESSLDRTLLEPISHHLPPPSVAPLKPHPVEPTAAGDKPRSIIDTRRSETLGSDSYAAKRHQSSQSQQSKVPIAGVLNDEAPVAASFQPVPAAVATAPVTPFSGRLSDILLDPFQQLSNKRRRTDGDTTPPALAAPENTLLTLPKPRQPPKKPSKRPRIPPLLQGLHQPPPLPPEGTRFPPITGETGSFGRDISDRVGLRSPVGPDRGKEKDPWELPNVAGTPIHAEGEKRSQESPTGKPVPSSGSEKENGRPIEGDASAGPHKPKETKVRKKWSDQETKDLLVGVSRFGIGSWKKILHCPDFTFNNRTAVDLKDRFRTCCPGEGLKLRVRKRKSYNDTPSLEHQNTVSSPPSAYNSQQSAQQQIPEATSDKKNQCPKRRRAESHRKGPAELAEMGILGPFKKTFRRERREFTQKDDENLLKGFEKYGASWHSMRDDPELDFGNRHATDLRDRFRIRYPEQFANAGYKPKPKDERMLKEKLKKKEASDSQEAAISSSTNSTTETQRSDGAVPEMEASNLVELPGTTQAKTNLKAHALRQPLLTSFPSPLEDFADLASEEEGTSTRSPVVLNRNIFQWADANPHASQAITAAPANFPTVPSDPSLNLFPGMDGIHINPLATLELPMGLVPNSVLTAMPSSNGQPSSASLMLTLPVTQGPPPPTTNTSTTTYPSTAAPPPTSSAVTAPPSKHIPTNPLLRTPNLPTIVFPNVPDASARNAVHNLPPPADLLSGLDLDVVPHGMSNFVMDDNGVVALPSAVQQSGFGLTLAPVLGGSTGGEGGGGGGGGGGNAAGGGSGGGMAVGRVILGLVEEVGAERKVV